MPGYVRDLEEFAFFNQQLAGMLEAGIPLEGGLEKLTRDMQKGRLKTVLSRIRERLRRGEPFGEVIAAFKDRLPPLYYRLCIIGEKSERLPSVLSRLASYYRWQGMLKGRLKTLMFYPMIVMTAAIAVSVFLAGLLPGLFQEIVVEFYGPGRVPQDVSRLLWLPYYYLGVLTGIFLLYIVALYTPLLKFITDSLAWRLKASKYLQLANISWMFDSLLTGEVPFSESVALVKELSDNSVTRRAMEGIERRAADGTPVSEAFRAESVFPAAYTWILEHSGERLPEGFRENAEIYGRRARRYMDICIFASLPLALVIIGSLVASNFIILYQVMQATMGAMGSI